MTKRERLEDLGKLSILLKQIINHDIFSHAESKHGYEPWKLYNHDKIEDDEPRGLKCIFQDISWVLREIEDCYAIAHGDEDDD